jgi:hypothetical protein
MGSLDLQNIAVFHSKMCTDTPLVPARLCPPICLVVPARHAQCACLRRRTGPPSSAPYCHAILSSARVSGSPENLPVILHDGRERDFSPMVQCGVYSVSATISFALTVPSVLLLINSPNLGSPFY